MDFKYKRDALIKLLWPPERCHIKPVSTIPKTIRIRDQEYDTVELYLKVTRSKHISLLSRYEEKPFGHHTVKSLKNPKGAGRKAKYTYEDRLWMANNTPREIAAKYEVNLPYARMMRNQSKDYIEFSAGNTRSD